MVDVALQGGGAIPVAEQVDRAKVLQRLRLGDVGIPPSDPRRRDRRSRSSSAASSFRWSTARWPALRTSASLSCTTRVWNPVTEKFGAIAPIYGTIVTSLIAMLIAVPVGLFIALFLTELCPMWLRRPIGIAIELLAGIPSPSSTASGACSCSRRSCSNTCSRS